MKVVDIQEYSIFDLEFCIDFSNFNTYCLTSSRWPSPSATKVWTPQWI